MKIGEVAERSGVPAKTIRFWEDHRLLPAPARTPAGYREFDPAILERLAFIRHAQDLPDVLQGEPGGLGVPDEREALQDGRVEFAVADRSAGRSGEEAMVFPEPNRLGWHPGPFGHLTDLHAVPLTFHPTGMFSLAGGSACRRCVTAGSPIH